MEKMHRELRMSRGSYGYFTWFTQTVFSYTRNISKSPYFSQRGFHRMRPPIGEEYYTPRSKKIFFGMKRNPHSIPSSYHPWNEYTPRFEWTNSAYFASASPSELWYQKYTFSVLKCRRNRMAEALWKKLFDYKKSGTLIFSWNARNTF